MFNNEKVRIYSAYLQASYFLNRRANQDLSAAEKILANVIKLAPGFAAGWACYAHALHLQGHLREAGDAARQAIKLAPDDCEAHLALALVLQRLEWNWADAETHFRRALDVQPLSCRAHHWYGGLLSDLGRSTPALRELKLAVELDPLDVPAATAHGICTFFARAFEAAIPKLERAIELGHRLRLDRFPWEAHCYLGASYVFTNNEHLALAYFRKALRGAPDNLLVQAHYVHGLARLGYVHKARDEMHKLLNFSDVPDCPFYVGAAWAALNERTQAFASLQTALAQRDGALTLLKVHPYLANLRSESAYSNLLRRMKFPA